MQYSKVKELVAGYELYQQTKLKCQAAVIFKDALTHGMCNGEVQFASVENSPGAGEDDDLPIVVGVGINYGQQNKCSADFSHHLRDNAGQPTIEDKPGLMVGYFCRISLKCWLAVCAAICSCS